MNEKENELSVLKNKANEAESVAINAINKSMKAIREYIKAYFDGREDAHVEYGYSLWVNPYGHVIEEDMADAECEEVELDDICCYFDGGNHPEYASNMFSTLHGVGIKGGELYLNLEDDDEYYSHRWTYTEWQCAFEAITGIVSAGIAYEIDCN